jgi:hypothetical protein
MREVAYDYDQCIYFVSREEGSDIIKFGFSCNCSKQILANGGEQMLNDLYKGTYHCLLTYIQTISCLNQRHCMTMTLHWASIPLNCLRLKVFLEIDIYCFLIEIKKTMDEAQ